MRQPPDYNTAVPFAKPNDSTQHISTNWVGDQIFQSI